MHLFRLHQGGPGGERLGNAPGFPWTLLKFLCGVCGFEGTQNQQERGRRSPSKDSVHPTLH